MQFKPPKNDAKYQWTNHVQQKMMYYGISESLIKRIIRFPTRKEEGIAPKTTAVMQPGSNKKNPTETWVMYQALSKSTMTQAAKVKIISAWKYPGITPVGKRIQIPDDVLQDLEDSDTVGE